MERITFNREMARLSVAFNRVLDAPLLGTYWDRVRNHSDAIFAAAVGHLIDTAEHFPNVAAIHRAYYEERDRLADERRTTETRSEEDALAEGRRNALRLAVEGLPSDRALARGHGVAHPVGDPLHDGILRTYDRTIRTLEVLVQDRFDELEARPADHDLRRRAELLARTLAETCERRAHFAATGTSLPPKGMPTDVPAVPPGTLFLCPVCKATEDAPGGFVRVDVMAGRRHFGGAGEGMKHTPIPCPACNRDAYAAYVEKYGRPEGMPAVAWAGVA